MPAALALTSSLAGPSAGAGAGRRPPTVSGHLDPLFFSRAAVHSILGNHMEGAEPEQAQQPAGPDAAPAPTPAPAPATETEDAIGTPGEANPPAGTSAPAPTVAGNEGKGEVARPPPPPPPAQLPPSPHPVHVSGGVPGLLCRPLVGKGSLATCRNCKLVGALLFTGGRGVLFATLQDLPCGHPVIPNPAPFTQVPHYLD
jgi:hypothetical protein